MIVLFPGCICHLSLSLNNLHWKTSKGLLPVEERRKWERCENVFCPPTSSGSSRREFLKERWVVGIRYSPGAKWREKWGKPSVSSGSRNSSGSLNQQEAHYPQIFHFTMENLSPHVWSICPWRSFETGLSYFLSFRWHSAEHRSALQVTAHAWHWKIQAPS